MEEKNSFHEGHVRERDRERDSSWTHTH